MADEHVIISRAKAKELGLKRYFTGKSCKVGHVSERAVVNGSCLNCCAQRAATKYQSDPEPIRRRSREWANKNLDEIKKRRRLAYAENPQKFIEFSKKWIKNNREKVRASRKLTYHRDREDAIRKSTEYREKNKEAVNARNLERYHRLNGRNKQAQRRKENLEAHRERDRRWQKENRERRRASCKRWTEKHGDRARAIKLAIEHNRRARKLNSIGTHTAADLASILKRQKFKCAECGSDLLKVGRHLDHIVPLALGGSNDKGNLQYLCPPHNLNKGAKDPLVYAREQGRLL